MQIKNIIYHCVKNAVTKLAERMNEEKEEEKERVGASNTDEVTGEAT